MKELHCTIYVYCSLSFDRNLIKRSGDYTSLPDDLQNAITIDEITKAYKLISDNGYICRTPIIDGTAILGLSRKNAMRHVKSFGMKLENMQFSGKIYITVVLFYLIFEFIYHPSRMVQKIKAATISRTLNGIN